ncbi:MAG: hypothetical protein ACI8XG_000497 [Congregibacter sp.]|jgi:hypothetical protein
MVSSSTVLYVFVSIILGIFAFTLTGALNIWWQRNRREISRRGPISISWVMLRFIGVTASCIAVILLVRELLPYELTSVQGVLKSEGLFPVKAIERYQGRLEIKDGIVQESEPLVSYTRKLGPAEEAESLMQRGMLKEQIAEGRLRLNSNAPVNELQRVSELERLRAERKSALDLKEKIRARDLLAIDSLNFELDEQTSKLSLARKEMEYARGAISTGLISKIDYDRREEKLRMENLRIKEIKSRLEFALNATPVIVSGADEENALRLNELLDKGLVNLEPPGTDFVLFDLERRLREVNQVLSGREQQPIVVDAPWSGTIGYINPSSVLSSGDIIGVLVKQDSLFVEVLVPVDIAGNIENGARIEVTNESLRDLGVTLTGRLQRSQIANPEQMMLDVRIDHRSDLIRDLALNKEVKVTVSFFNQSPKFFDDEEAFLPQVTSLNLALILAVFFLFLIIFLRRGNTTAPEAKTTTLIKKNEDDV